MSTEVDAQIGYALSLSKTGNIGGALRAVNSLEFDLLSPSQLRKLALIYSYCSEDEQCERTWIELIRRYGPGPGDCFMLGNAQLALLKYAEAAKHYLLEYNADAGRASQYYRVGAGMSLAFCLIKEQNYVEANRILNQLDPDASLVLVREGRITRNQLLSMAAVS